MALGEEHLNEEARMYRPVTLISLAFATLTLDFSAYAEPPRSDLPSCTGQAAVDAKSTDNSHVLLCHPIIKADGQVPAVATVRVPPTSTSVRMDPSHPLKIGEAHYPAASKRAHEEGTCTVQITVSIEGSISASKLVSSSGHRLLDQVCLKAVAVGQRMLPATYDGKPAEKTLSLPIVWKLTT